MPLVTITQGKIGYIFARDGKPLEQTQTLASNVNIEDFQDGKAQGWRNITAALDQYWRSTTVAPWTGFYLFLLRLFSIEYIYMDWIDLFLFIFILLIGLAGLRDLPIEFSLYIWLTLAVLFMRGTPPHLLASYSRYFLALFPIFILPAGMKMKNVQVMAASISLCLQMLLAWVFLLGSWVA
ncbi:MAG: hypothetical protein HGA82_00960 [Anaerolineales bacterium]|nr:hypothetical protein [Anaerolineales bacterium]